MLTKRAWLLLTLQLLYSFGWDIINYPCSHKTDLTPIGLPSEGAGKLFSYDDKVKDAVKEFGGKCLRQGYKKSIPRLTKCINQEGEYVKKIV